MQLTDTILEDAAVRALGADLAGVAIAPGDADYDRARAVWNAMIDRRPAVIARCLNVSDVRTALSFAREHGLPIAVRGGGHNVAGNAVCDGGIVIDLSPMKGIHVDPRARTARLIFSSPSRMRPFTVPTGSSSSSAIWLCVKPPK